MSPESLRITRSAFALAACLVVAAAGRATAAALPTTVVNDAARDTGKAVSQYEPSIVVAADGSLVATFFDSGVLASPPTTGPEVRLARVARSTDGGRTWSDRGLLAGGPGGAARGILARSEPTGTLFVVGEGLLSSNTLPVWRSTDHGETFDAPVNAVPGSAAVHRVAWIATDPFPGALQGAVYVAYEHNSAIALQGSLDDGLTWPAAPATSIASLGLWPCVAVGPGHDVYVCWYAPTTPPTISIRRAAGGGAFGSAITVATIEAAVNSTAALALGAFRANCAPQVAVDPVSGHVYVVYARADGAAGDPANVYVQRSTNGGASFEAPVRVDRDAGRSAQFMPAIAITPDGEHVCVTWSDRRRDPKATAIERWAAIGTVSGGGITWGSDFRIGEPSPPTAGQDSTVQAQYMGERVQMAASDTAFYAVWSDARAPYLARPGRVQPDVRFVAIPVQGAGAIVDVRSISLADETGEGDLQPNECGLLTVTLENVGGATAAPSVVDVVSLDPQLLVQGGHQGVGSITPGASRTNFVPVRVNRGTVGPCRPPAPLQIQVTGPDGSPTVSWSNAAIGYEYLADAPAPVADLQTTVVTITVASATLGPIDRVRLSLQVAHSFVGDLVVRLRSPGPNARQVLLWNRKGGSAPGLGAGCSATTALTFDDDGVVFTGLPVTAPVGTYRPDSALALFAGLAGTDVAGEWQLVIEDQAASDSGHVVCATLTLETHECAPGPGLCSEAVAADRPAPEGLVFAPPAPNPARGPTRLSFALPEAGPVMLAVHDLLGRRVRELANGPRRAGSYDVVWDGRDAGGRTSPPGVYFARLEAGGQTLVHRLVVLGR